MGKINAEVAAERQQFAAFRVVADGGQHFYLMAELRQSHGNVPADAAGRPPYRAGKGIVGQQRTERSGTDVHVGPADDKDVRIRLHMVSFRFAGLTAPALRHIFPLNIYTKKETLSMKTGRKRKGSGMKAWPSCDP